MFFSFENVCQCVDKLIYFVAASFITYIMCLLAVSLVITVSILSIHFHSTDKPVPKWAKIVVLNWIATLVCETRRRAKPEVSPSAKDPDKIPTVVSGSLISLDNSDKPQGGASPAELNLPGYLRAFILRRTQTDEITANLAVNKADWQAVSRVLDRFFLIIFSIAMFIIIAETFYKYWEIFHEWKKVPEKEDEDFTWSNCLGYDLE